MTYSICEGGVWVNNYHEKQIRFILSSNADIVGFQESAVRRAATRLGEALGWCHWQSNRSVGIISRYPISKEHGLLIESGGVRVNLNGDRDFILKSELNI